MSDLEVKRGQEEYVVEEHSSHYVEEAKIIFVLQCKEDDHSFAVASVFNVEFDSLTPQELKEFKNYVASHPKVIHHNDMKASN